MMNITYLIISLIVVSVLLVLSNRNETINIKDKYPNVKLANTFVNKDITQALFDELKDLTHKLSNCKNLTLSGVCKKYKYIPATTDENITMDLDNITKIILGKINSDTNNFRFMKNLRIAAAQINTTVGDINGNVDLISNYIEKSQEYGVDIVAFPELSITGYPPEDLLFNDEYINANIQGLEKIKNKFNNILSLIGFVEKDDQNNKIYNSVAGLFNGKINFSI